MAVPEREEANWEDRFRSIDDRCSAMISTFEEELSNHREVELNVAQHSREFSALATIHGKDRGEDRNVRYSRDSSHSNARCYRFARHFLALVLLLEVMCVIFELQWRTTEDASKHRHCDFVPMAYVQLRQSSSSSSPLTTLLCVDVVEEMRMRMTTTTWPWRRVAFVHHRHTEYNKVNGNARIFMPFC
jgi:hypothetical protein